MDLRRGSIRLAFLGWALGSVLLGNLINGSVKGSLVVQTPAARIDSVADVMRQRPPPTPYTLKTEFLEKALEVLRARWGCIPRLIAGRRP
ncbi:hypothetical protein V5799_031003 [Amblyomma americanum]|uniref:Uncharacterized protein n=1 Tax=Amblyomma americanum TaxID=6943 RepID=A0AAQ4EM08_AMBAM